MSRVAGHALATLDTNERFYRRLLEKGPRWVDPRLFPATSPNAGAGHVSIFFGLTGPCFAVNDGLDGALEALEAAAELVASGDAPRMVVVAADDAGPMARAWMEDRGLGGAIRRGATALLLVAEDDELAGEGVRPVPSSIRGDGSATKAIEHGAMEHGAIGHGALAAYLF